MAHVTAGHSYTAATSIRLRLDTTTSMTEEKSANIFDSCHSAPTINSQNVPQANCGPVDITADHGAYTSNFGETRHTTPPDGVDEWVRRCELLESQCPPQGVCQPEGYVDDGGLGDSVRQETCIARQDSRALRAPSLAYIRNRINARKDICPKTVEAQVAAFRTWTKPHRTNEYINPGEYRGFLKWIARCLTFYIPSWFLKKALKMNDRRRRLAFRQKVFVCILVAVIYMVLCYFLIIQPVASCVVKVHIGMFTSHGQFCNIVRHVIYIYVGMGGTFMLLVALCAASIRYKGRSFEEHDDLVIMHIPCYNENEYVLRKTIDSCVSSTYARKRKLLFIVADGTVTTPEHKATYKILLEDIFDHKAELAAGIETKSRQYASFSEDGTSDNFAVCCTGFFREVPYVIVVKIGRDDEQGRPKPGNRGKRDSQLLVYNFLHFANYHAGWSPLFEDIEYQIRECLDMDARDAMYMLVADSDTEIQPTGISYLVNQLAKDPTLIGVCGYTGVSNPVDSFVACSQVFEYWLTHAVLKALESVCSNVLVLSGCFTIYRLKWPNNQPAILFGTLLKDYAGSHEKTLHEHNLLSIGEDRYLSTLAIRYFGSDCRLRYFAAAQCTTTASHGIYAY